MRETVKRAGKGPRGSHCALLVSVRGTYRVYRPTNHDRLREFFDHAIGDRTMQPNSDRETLLDRDEFVSSSSFYDTLFYKQELFCALGFL